ncbi:MAG TPA: DUF885 domain-containing protein [Thermoplasmata archaeon]|nr:DUF885 domain-containing protein [Thermoplasmata archaeon]
MASGGGIDAIEREIADALFEFQPAVAVGLGRHEFDGRLPDYSPASTDRWSARITDLLGRLTAVDATGLTPDRRVDQFLLRLVLEGSRFDLVDAQRLERNPMTYLSALSLTPYLVREYAPAPARVEAIARALAGAPQLLDQGRRRLAGPLPRPFVDLALAIGGGLASHFRDAEAFAAAQGLGPSVAAPRETAEAALTGFLAWLRETELPRADPAFALGPEKYQRLLFVREGIEAPVEDLERAGVADIARNRARLEELARGEHLPVSALLSHLQHDHPNAGELLATAQGYVAECRTLVEAKQLATIPEPAAVRVEETPVWGRSTTTASMDAPGPFDAHVTEGIYFVTLVDPAWTPEQQQEWLRTMNRPMLRNTAVHEVYPGHYLQALHFRANAGSLTRKIYASPSYVEGWAHYAEQLAIEAGLGAGAVAAEATQLLDALLRDCRLLASIRMHTQGWTVEQATQLFEREAFLDRLPAEREAIRGTFDPEYFCYTLGKLAILDVRKRLLTSRFSGNLRAFHDTLLRFGCPPVGLLDALLEGAVPSSPTTSG